MSFRPYYTGREFLEAAARQRTELQIAQSECARLGQIHQGRRADVEARATRALEELVGALLPSMDTEARARAAALTGYSPLTHPDVSRSMEAERQWLHARVAAIEADPRFANRELLRAPRVGSLTRAILELEEYRAALAPVLAAATHPRLERLLESGYGTDAYQEKWWRSAYYADWEAADQILERFPGKKSFGEVRSEVLEARSATREYDARIAEHRAEWAKGQALDAEHAQHNEALRTLDHRHFQRARQALARHLQETDMSVLGPRLASDPNVEILAKRWSGLAAKLVYIDRIAEAELGPMQAAIGASLQKLDRDITKYSRPKNAYAQIPGEAFERRFQSRQDRYTRGWDRFKRSYDAVYSYDRFDAVNLAQSFLWWDVMTDGRLDGDFIPEVASFHGRNPGYRYQHDRYDDDMSDAAAAAAFADQSGHTGDRSFDAS